jgi:uncharacterized membrane protein
MSNSENSRLFSVELLISTILRYGVLVCTGIMGVGLLGRLTSFGSTSESTEQVIQTLLKGELLKEPTLPQTVNQLTQELAGFRADAIMAVGLALLISLPMIRVGTTLILFILEKDWKFVAITGMVFSVLIASIWIGYEI